MLVLLHCMYVGRRVTRHKDRQIFKLQAFRRPRRRPAPPAAPSCPGQCLPSCPPVMGKLQMGPAASMQCVHSTVDCTLLGPGRVACQRKAGSIRGGSRPSLMAQPDNEQGASVTRAAWTCEPVLRAPHELDSTRLPRGVHGSPQPVGGAPDNWSLNELEGQNARLSELQGKEALGYRAQRITYTRSRFLI